MRKIRKALLLCALPGIFACQTKGEDPSRGSPDLRPAAAGEEGNLRFRVQADALDMKGVLIEVFDHGVLVGQRYVELENDPLPANLVPVGASAGSFGAASFVLPSGQYQVKATPMQSATEPSALCAPIEQPVEVHIGKTEEVVLVSRCDQPGNGALDIIVTTDRIPVITALTFDPSKFVRTCEPLKIQASITDPDNDPITFRWSVKEAPQGALYTLDPQGTEAHFLAKTAGLFALAVEGCDPHSLCASLTFPVHVTLSEDADGDGIGDGCEDPGAGKKGRVVTMVLTMTDQHMLTHPGSVVPKVLIGNAVRWVSPVEKPLVAVVRDDNLGGETPADPEFVRTVLGLLGYAVDLIEEPAEGLTLDMVEKYDVIWFANPGYQVDDQASVDVLLALFAAGHGLVLQGDDITWNPGLAPLTHLKFEDNGSTTCGVVVNNNQGASYLVSIQSASHPVIEGLAGTQFLYGDDIDLSTLVGKGAEVLASATLDPQDRCGPQPCPTTPVIVAFDPNR